MSSLSNGAVFRGRLYIQEAIGQEGSFTVSLCKYTISRKFHVSEGRLRNLLKNPLEPPAVFLSAAGFLGCFTGRFDFF